MNRGRWAKKDIDFISDNYKVLPMADLCNYLNRSEDAIRWQASRCGLTSEKPKEYKPDEIKFISDNMGEMPIYKIALHLGRSAKGVKNQITKRKQIENVKNYEKTAEFEFDKDVPFGVGKHYEFKTVLNSMQINESFEYMQSERATMNNVITLFEDKIFKTKLIDEKTRRVWRIF